jgi:hypothetical protein
MSMIEPRTIAEDPGRAAHALRLPVGVASPLWLLYAGAAGAGMAYWLMTRWARPVNLEALLGASQDAAQAAVKAIAPAAEAVVAAAEAAQESLETVVEEVAEVQAMAIESLPEPETPPAASVETAALVVRPTPVEALAPIEPAALFETPAAVDAATPEPVSEPGPVVEALSEAAVPPKPKAASHDA